MTYTVTISETEPENIEIGHIWIKPSVSHAFLKIMGWANFIYGEPIAVYTEGTVEKTFIAQATEPAGTVGQIWHNTTNGGYYIYLNDWQMYFGSD